MHIYILIVIVPIGSPSISAVSVLNTSINFTWLPLPLEEQNGVIQRYHVFVYEINTNKSMKFETINSTIQVSNLHPFYSYELLVAAETNIGKGPYSQPIVHVLPEASKCYRFTVEEPNKENIRTSTIKRLSGCPLLGILGHHN